MEWRENVTGTVRVCPSGTDFQKGDIVLIAGRRMVVEDVSDRPGGIIRLRPEKQTRWLRPLSLWFRL